MKKCWLLALLLALTLTAGALAQSVRLPEVTLYSPNKYDHSFERALFNFETGRLARAGGRWDLTYGTLYAGEEQDWFQVSTSKGSRSAFRDLGALKWTDPFEVSVVQPFPKLRAEEQRVITVDTSGADGKPGAPGRAGGANDLGVSAEENLRGSPISRGNLPGGPIEQPRLSRRNPPPPPDTSRAPQDGVPKIDPSFVKAVVGHIYVIHVVEGHADYYALFRVESMERGDHCTISWKIIPSPESRTSN